MSIESRLKKLEKQVSIGAREGGIAKWAMDYAEQRARDERDCRAGIKEIDKALTRLGGKERTIEPMKLQTEEAVLNLAKEMSEKYTSLEDYKKNKPPPTKEDLAELDAAIERCG